MCPTAGRVSTTVGRPGVARGSASVYQPYPVFAWVVANGQCCPYCSPADLNDAPTMSLQGQARV